MRRRPRSHSSIRGRRDRLIAQRSPPRDPRRRARGARVGSSGSAGSPPPGGARTGVRVPARAARLRARGARALVLEPWLVCRSRVPLRCRRGCAPAAGSRPRARPLAPRSRRRSGSRRARAPPARPDAGASSSHAYGDMLFYVNKLVSASQSRRAVPRPARSRASRSSTSRRRRASSAPRSPLRRPDPLPDDDDAGVPVRLARASGFALARRARRRRTRSRSRLARGRRSSRIRPGSPRARRSTLALPLAFSLYALARRSLRLGGSRSAPSLIGARARADQGLRRCVALGVAIVLRSRRGRAGPARGAGALVYAAVVAAASPRSRCFALRPTG